MSTLSTEFERLMQRVRAGCPHAAREVFDLYSEHVRRVVRRQLHHRLRNQYDSLDFLQAAWASFFRTALGQHTFNTPDELVAFLSRVASNKVVDVFRRRLQTDKHNLNRELSLSDPAGPPESDPPGRQPTPSQLAIAEEQWERLLQGQPPRQRQVLELLRQGYNQREVAEQVGIHPKVLQRFLQQLAKRLDPP